MRLLLVTRMFHVKHSEIAMRDFAPATVLKLAIVIRISIIGIASYKHPKSAVRDFAPTTVFKPALEVRKEYMVMCFCVSVSIEYHILYGMSTLKS